MDDDEELKLTRDELTRLATMGRCKVCGHLMALHDFNGGWCEIDDCVCDGRRMPPPYEGPPRTLTGVPELSPCVNVKREFVFCDGNGDNNGDE